MSVDAESAQLILRRYDIVASQESAVAISPSTYEVNVGGHRRDDGQKVLTVTVGNVSVSRLCPFHNGDSRIMVQRLFVHRALARRVEFESMLASLVARAASMFDQEPLAGFILERVRLDNGHYTISAVHMVRSRN